MLAPQERILEMSRRYEALQRGLDASEEALLRATADVQRLEADCSQQRQQLADHEAKIADLNAALQAAKVSPEGSVNVGWSPCNAGVGSDNR